MEKGYRKPPLNKVKSRIYRILLSPPVSEGNNPIRTATRELIKLFTIKNILSYKWYQIKYWIWRKYEKK
jgi:hypothetical protein